MPSPFISADEVRRRIADGEAFVRELGRISGIKGGCPRVDLLIDLARKMLAEMEAREATYLDMAERLQEAGDK